MLPGGTAVSAHNGHSNGAGRDGKKELPRIMRYEVYRQAHPAPALEREPRVRHLEPQEIQATHAFTPEYYEDVKRRWSESFVPVRPEQRPQAAEAKPTAVTDELTGHNYDGIEEYDNPTPGWWYMVFAATIVFAVLYTAVYHSVMVPTLIERHAYAEAASLERQFAELNKIPMGEEKILAIMAEPDWLSRGQAIFAGTCAVCHGADGSGVVGPNLTDELYKNVSSLEGIADLVTNGTPNGAMPAQKNMLNENEIALAAAYAASLRGKNLPTGETVNPDYTGHPIPAWPEPAGGLAPSDEAGDAAATEVSLRE